MMSRDRIGQGIDVHPLVENRPLVLGGVEIVFHLGLDGDTDGDVLSHAVMDALLGAVALGDLGTHFHQGQPDVDGARSVRLLERVSGWIAQEGYAIGNLDVTVVAQAPRLSPYTEAMRQTLAEAMAIQKSQISIKATTTDHLGMLGRSEGIMALATVLLHPLVEILEDS
ncbi:MAG: 2-C-methyl-D-erythritol 2,4-cyclodiphosphate synthase [Sulfobacillus sp.]